MGNKRVIPATVGGVGLKIMNAVAVSSTTVYHSTVFNAAFLDNIGLQVKFIGSMVGTLIVEGSTDNSEFDALTFNPVLTQPSGSNLSYLINLNQVPFPYVRVTYTNASASGTLTVTLSAKDLN